MQGNAWPSAGPGASAAPSGSRGAPPGAAPRSCPVCAVSATAPCGGPEGSSESGEQVRHLPSTSDPWGRGGLQPGVWAVGGGPWAVAAAALQRNCLPFPSVNAHIYVLAKMEMTVTKSLGSPFALCRERRRKPSPGWETKSPLLADPGFCSNPQGPRGDQRMRFIGQAGAALQGLSPQGLALFPAPSLAGGSGEGLTPGLAA